MKVTIAHYVLDTDTRELTSAHCRQMVRPKTLALLLYLMQRKGQLVSKAQLLADVWDDVQVNEGVIFQSIREIRTLFPDLTVIQNHPRKGYQWLRDVDFENVSCEAGKDSLTSFSKDLNNTFRLPRMIALALLVVLFVAGLVVQYVSLSKNNLMVLPIQNRIDRNDLHWINESGAQQIQQALQTALQHFAISQAETSSLQSEDNWSLQVKLYGDVYDYKLIYRLVQDDVVIQGVVLSYAMEHAIEQLTQELKGIFAEPVNPVLSPQKTALAQVVMAYETDWQMALPQLQQFVVEYPDNVEGYIMLSRLLLWQQHDNESLAITEAALSKPSVTQQQRARLHYLRALAYQHTSADMALAEISKGVSLSQSQQSWLVRAQLEELQGEILQVQELPVDALRSFLKAQSFYDEINLPVNAAGLKLKLSGLYLALQQEAMAARLFEQAKTLIQSKEMSFLYGELQEYAERFQSVATEVE